MCIDHNHHFVFVCMSTGYALGKCGYKYGSGLGSGFKSLCLNPLGKVGRRPTSPPTDMGGIVLHGGSRAGAAACSTYLGRTRPSSVAIPRLMLSLR